MAQLHLLLMLLLDLRRGSNSITSRHLLLLLRRPLPLLVLPRLLRHQLLDRHHLRVPWRRPPRPRAPGFRLRLRSCVLCRARRRLALSTACRSSSPRRPPPRSLHRRRQTRLRVSSRGLSIPLRPSTPRRRRRRLSVRCWRTFCSTRVPSRERALAWVTPSQRRWSGVPMLLQRWTLR